MRVTGAGLEATGADGGEPGSECSRDGRVRDDSTPLPRGNGGSVCNVGEVWVCVCSWRLDEPMEEFEYAARGTVEP